MLKIMKKAVVFAAIAGVGALAGPAMASADTDLVWTQNGTPLTATPVSFTADGDLTLTTAQGLTVTCVGVHITGSINNSGTPLMGNGSVSSVTFPPECETNVPDCVAVASAVTLPWSLTLVPQGANHRLQVGGVHFTNTFSGPCPSGLPTGVPISESGTLNPIVTAGGTLTFDGGASNTVTGPLGSAVVTGDVTVTSPTGISTATIVT